MGEVAERSEDREGKRIGRIIQEKALFTLSVTFGDSSPKGRAKGRTLLHSMLA